MRISTQAVRRLAGRWPSSPGDSNCTFKSAATSALNGRRSGWVHRRLREPPRDAPTMKIVTTFRPQPSNQAFYLYIAE